MAKPQFELGIVAGRGCPEFAEGIAERLNVDTVEVELRDHANSEQYVRFDESVRRKALFIFGAHALIKGRSVDQQITEQRMLINAARLAGAPRITAAFPYMGYSRGDRKARSGESIPAADTARDFEFSGAHRLFTCDLHSGQVQGAVKIPFDHITARLEKVKWLRQNWLTEHGKRNVMLVGADNGRAKDTVRAARRLGIPYAIIDKRHDEVTGKTYVEGVLGDVKGYECMLWDDMIDSAGTTKADAEAVMERGASGVSAIVSHGINSKVSAANIATSPLKQVIVTNTLPQNKNRKLIEKASHGRVEFHVLDLIPLHAWATRRIWQNKSISKAFQDEHLE